MKEFLFNFISLAVYLFQIQLAKIIWETTANELRNKEYEEILRERIYLRRLPSELDQSINHSIDHLQHLLSNVNIDKDERAHHISTCSKKITQYKFDLMTSNLAIIQSLIRGYQRKLIELQNQLLTSCIGESLKEAIKNREENMRKRHEIYLKHKSNTFFDEAPMVILHE